MADEGNPTLFNKGAWKAVALAIAILVAGQGILLWQYQRLERGRLADLEQKVEEQQQTIEVQAARDALAQTGAASVQDMGKVMAELAPKTKGKADGSQVSKIVKELLG